MSETHTTPDPAAAWSQIEAQHALRIHLAADAQPLNKAALFDALAAAAITSVLVTFDGAGDSGQIEAIDVTSGQEPTALPTGDVEIVTPAWDGSGLERRCCNMRDAIEALAYAFLEETHDGWENNEGAFGEFRFDVMERTIELDYNERIETSQHHGHSW